MTALADRIEEAYGDLSPKEQRAAVFMRDHLADLAVYNATEVAHLSGVSKATVSRLYRRLGFANADELRDHVRAIRGAGAPRPADAPVDFGEHVEREVANLRATLDGVVLGPTASLIAHAKRVLVIGFRNSYPMALQLRQQLAQAREFVELLPVPGQSIGEELSSLRADDVVVLIGFRRRPSHFGRMVTIVERSPASLVLIIEPGGHRYGAQADHVLDCRVDSVSAFDSYAAAASLISLLSAAVLGVRLREGKARIARIGATSQAIDELEAP